MFFLTDIVIESVLINNEGGSRFFVGFLSATIVSLELLNLCHIGIRGAVGLHFQTREGQKKKLFWPITIISLIKVGIFFICMTLTKWTTNAIVLLWAGCLIVIALSITRVMSYLIIHKRRRSRPMS